MEMRINRTENITVKLGTTNNSDRLIAKMNMAYNSPTKEEVRVRNEVRSISKSLNLADEYSKMEQAYLSGYKGFGENLDYLG